MKRILVTGDREWKDAGWIRMSLCSANQFFGEIEVIEGEARGADRIARQVCEEMGWKFHPFPADWETHGKAAGPIRNQRQLAEGKPDMVMAFHLNIKNSRGTRDMVDRAMKANVPVWICTEGADALLTTMLMVKGLFG